MSDAIAIGAFVVVIAVVDSDAYGSVGAIHCSVVLCSHWQKMSSAILLNSATSD